MKSQPYFPFVAGGTVTRLALGLLASLCFAGSASAQYMWLDEKGVKQFSDQPPPKSVPKNRILKSPEMQKPSAAKIEAPHEGEATDAAANGSNGNNGSNAAAAASAASKPRGPLTTAERNADFQKRKLEQAEKDRKAEQETAQATAKQRECERLRSYQRSLNGGARISQTDKSGERVILDEKQIEQEKKEVKRNLEACQSAN